MRLLKGDTRSLEYRPSAMHRLDYKRVRMGTRPVTSSHVLAVRLRGVVIHAFPGQFGVQMQAPMHSKKRPGDPHKGTANFGHHPKPKPWTQALNPKP